MEQTTRFLYDGLNSVRELQDVNSPAVAYSSARVTRRHSSLPEEWFLDRAGS